MRQLDMECGYKTQSLYEASYLLCKGCILAGKQKAGDKYFIIFEDREGAREEALKFYNGAEAAAKLLFDNYRSLKDYIFEK